MMFSVGMNSCKQHTTPSENALRRSGDSASSLVPSSQNSTTTSEDSALQTVNTKQNDSTQVPHVTHKAEIITSKGTMLVHLFGDDAPKTVENFEKLCQKKFFNGMLFHRVVRDFIVQTGDPNTKSEAKRSEWGKGGQSAFGKPFSDELSYNSPSFRRGYKRGTLAMATQRANENTSQFFICLRDAPKLRREFTIFGEIADGLNVLDSIGATAIVPVLDSADGVPSQPITIRTIRILR